MASDQGHDIGPQAPVIDYEARLAELDSTPLFMRDLPDDDGSNVQLEALKSLIFDGTPDEIALNFKDQGNDYFKGKRYREALGFYTQGIDAKPDDQSLLEVLLCNRAACNLALENYGSTIRDCALAIRINPRSSKAYYRSATALKQLNRLNDALDACNRCLAFDVSNDAVQRLARQISAAVEQATLKAQERDRKEKEEREERNLLRQACTARQLHFISDKSREQLGTPYFDPEGERPFTPVSQIIFPVFFLYPQYNQSDFIAHFAEHTRIRDQLDAVFPEGGPRADWDVNGQYAAKAVSIYVITRRQRLLKIGANNSLADVFLKARTHKDGKADGLEIKDGCLSIVILPKGEVEKDYIDNFKLKRDGPEPQPAHMHS